MASCDKEKVIEEQLLQMGYCQPDWDSFRVHKPPPSTLVSCSLPSKATSMSRKQLFLIKVWPKIEGFYQEDEDYVAASHSETVVKNGLLTRIFRFSFDNEESRQRWLFVLEKRIDPGDDGLRRHIRQLWAIYTPLENLPTYKERLIFTRSFETHCQSSKYKMNKEPGVVSTLKKSFFAEIKSSLAELFQNNNCEADLMKDQPADQFFKGKEFQFEECGNQIIWAVSIRPVVENESIPEKTWVVSTDEQSLMLKCSKSSLRSKNPFEVEEDSVSLVEQLEIDRQIVERNILDFINFIWPKVRNFYLDLDGEEDDEISFAATQFLRNGYPTKALELHFDTMNEQNRWKVLFEVNIASSLPLKDWARSISPDGNYNETRTYCSYEKRGTSSVFGEDKNEYFKGFYKRWFLNEVQWKLVKCFSYDGKVFHASYDQTLYDFGKDLEFSNDGENIIWSFSVQKLTKYPIDDVPSQVWCYGLTDNFLPGESDDEDVLSMTDSEMNEALRSGNSTDIETDFSFASNITNISSITLAEKIKKKSMKKFRTLAHNIVRPVMKKPSWLSSTAKLLRFKSQKSCKKEESKSMEK